MGDCIAYKANWPVAQKLFLSSLKFLLTVSTEWLMVLFLYNPLGVTNSIGSNSHMESVESDGKEREIKEIKNIIKTKFSIYSSADSDLFFQRQQRWMRGCEREPVKRSLQF